MSRQDRSLQWPSKRCLLNSAKYLRLNKSGNLEYLTACRVDWSLLQHVTHRRACGKEVLLQGECLFTKTNPRVSFRIIFLVKGHCGSEKAMSGAGEQMCK